LLLAKPTTTPAAGAGDASVTVPVAVSPLVTEEGATERLARVADDPDGVLEAGFTLTVAEAELPEEAVIVAVEGVVTNEAVTGKVAVVSPAGTVTVAGTVTAGPLLDKLTDPPPAAAGDANVTVPVPVSPDVSEGGEIVNPEIVEAPCGITDSDALVVAPPAVPVMVAVVGCVTGEVATENSAVVCPCGTTALPPTRAAGLFDASDTLVPPAGAGLVRVTTPIAGVPAARASGAIVIDSALGAVPAGSITAVPLAEVCGLEAVTWNPVAVLSLGAWKEKVPLVWPCGMVTVLGS
jgi:hypothetical protein